MNKGTAIKAILYFGLVSLLGDVIYEGSRGILPSYLSYLGASAFIVGLIFGLGDILSYGFRLIAGLMADVTGKHWYFYLIGYVLIGSIVFIGLTHSIFLVALLVLIERFGKGIRAPCRDTLISVASTRLGAGKAFGLHELLDQVGSTLGPLILAAILLVFTEYSYAFISLSLPYALLLFFVLLTFSKFKGTIKVHPTSTKSAYSLQKRFDRPLILYTAAVFFNTIGLMHWSLILYKASYHLSASYVAMLYALIMGIDGIAAITSGYLYDKYGRSILIAPFILSALVSILALADGYLGVLISALLFGVVFGIQESVYRAAVADMCPTEYRGGAYGLFNTVYGLGFLINGSLFGLLIGSNIIAAGIVYVIVTQSIALILLLRLITRVPFHGKAR